MSDINVNIFSKGLVGHWSLNQASLRSTVIAADGTPYSNHGTITAGASAGFVNDRMGQSNGAYDFDGVATRIDVGTDSDLTVASGGFSIALWTEFDALGAAQRVLHKGGQGNTVYDYSIGLGGTGVLHYACSKTVGNVVGVDTDVEITDLNTWILVVGTYDGAATYKIYVDGVEVATSATSVSNTAVDNLFIGAKNNDSQFWNGSVADVRIYNRALALPEIALLNKVYNNNLGIGV